MEASVVFQNLWVEAEKGYRQKLSAEDGRHFRWRFWQQLSTRICRWRKQLQLPGRGFRWRLVFVSTDLLTDGDAAVFFISGEEVEEEVLLVFQNL